MRDGGGGGRKVAGELFVQIRTGRAGGATRSEKNDGPFICKARKATKRIQTADIQNTETTICRQRAQFLEQKATESKTPKTKDISKTRTTMS